MNVLSKIYVDVRELLRPVYMAVWRILRLDRIARVGVSTAKTLLPPWPLWPSRIDNREELTVKALDDELPTSDKQQMGGQSPREAPSGSSRRLSPCTINETGVPTFEALPDDHDVKFPAIDEVKFPGIDADEQPEDAGLDAVFDAVDTVVLGTAGCVQGVVVKMVEPLMGTQETTEDTAARDETTTEEHVSIGTKRKELESESKPPQQKKPKSMDDESDEQRETLSAPRGATAAHHALPSLDQARPPAIETSSSGATAMEEEEDHFQSSVETGEVAHSQQATATADNAEATNREHVDDMKVASHGDFDGDAVRQEDSVSKAKEAPVQLQRQTWWEESSGVAVPCGWVRKEARRLEHAMASSPSRAVSDSVDSKRDKSSALGEKMTHDHEPVETLPSAVPTKLVESRRDDDDGEGHMATREAEPVDQVDTPALEASSGLAAAMPVVDDAAPTFVSFPIIDEVKFPGIDVDAVVAAVGTVVLGTAGRVQDAVGRMVEPLMGTQETTDDAMASDETTTEEDVSVGTKHKESDAHAWASASEPDAEPLLQQKKRKSIDDESEEQREAAATEAVPVSVRPSHARSVRMEESSGVAMAMEERDRCQASAVENGQAAEPATTRADDGTSTTHGDTEAEATSRVDGDVEDASRHEQDDVKVKEPPATLCRQGVWEESSGVFAPRRREHVSEPAASCVMPQHVNGGSSDDASVALNMASVLDSSDHNEAMDVHAHTSMPATPVETNRDDSDEGYTASREAELVDDVDAPELEESSGLAAAMFTTDNAASSPSPAEICQASQPKQQKEGGPDGVVGDTTEAQAERMASIQDTSVKETKSGLLEESSGLAAAYDEPSDDGSMDEDAATLPSVGSTTDQPETAPVETVPVEGASSPLVDDVHEERNDVADDDGVPSQADAANEELSRTKATSRPLVVGAHNETHGAAREDDTAEHDQPEAEDGTGHEMMASVTPSWMEEPAYDGAVIKSRVRGKTSSFVKSGLPSRSHSNGESLGKETPVFSPSEPTRTPSLMSGFVSATPDIRSVALTSPSASAFTKALRGPSEATSAAAARSPFAAYAELLKPKPAVGREELEDTSLTKLADEAQRPERESVRSNDTEDTENDRHLEEIDSNDDEEDADEQMNEDGGAPLEGIKGRDVGDVMSMKKALPLTLVEAESLLSSSSDSAWSSDDDDDDGTFASVPPALAARAISVVYHTI